MRALRLLGAGREVNPNRSLGICGTQVRLVPGREPGRPQKPSELGAVGVVVSAKPTARGFSSQFLSISPSSLCLWFLCPLPGFPRVLPLSGVSKGFYRCTTKKTRQRKRASCQSDILERFYTSRLDIVGLPLCNYRRHFKNHRGRRAFCQLGSAIPTPLDPRPERPCHRAEPEPQIPPTQGAPGVPPAPRAAPALGTSARWRLVRKGGLFWRIRGVCLCASSSQKPKRNE